MKNKISKPEPTTEELLSSINRKISVLVSFLIADEDEKKFELEVQKVKKLNEWGLEISEIAEILGKSNKQISDQLYNIKKRKK